MAAMVDHLIAEILSLNVKLLACHARLAASTDSEALHDLRTTVRRLRSVLRPLRGLPGMDQVEEAAKGVGDLTTPLRDMQVLAAFLSEQGQDQAALKRLSVPQGSDIRAIESPVGRARSTAFVSARATAPWPAEEAASAHRKAHGQTVEATARGHGRSRP